MAGRWSGRFDMAKIVMENLVHQEQFSECDATRGFLFVPRAVLKSDCSAAICGSSSVRPNTIRHVNLYRLFV